MKNPEAYQRDKDKMCEILQKLINDIQNDVVDFDKVTLDSYKKEIDEDGWYKEKLIYTYWRKLTA